MKFKNFILNENNENLARRISNVLNAMHNILENSDGMGPRQMIDNIEGIVDEIRRVLHTQWEENQKKYLEVLQKVGVALKKSIEEKSDLVQILQDSTIQLENLANDLGLPLNRLASPEK